jgi:hypothetical protein
MTYILHQRELKVEPVSTGLKHPASFRDPSGFMFRAVGGQLLRQVNRCYESNYHRLMDSGLYKDLVDERFLIEHEEVSIDLKQSDEALRVIQPRELSTISYPYEWAFSAFKDAALLTLDVQKRALKHGMTLKDASAYNVQFDGARPIFIDTLSFEVYNPGDPWVAYGQFCRHFMAPLALMAKKDIRLNSLLISHIDGIPLDLASKLLPWKTRCQFGLLVHLHLHSKMVNKHADTSQSLSKTTASPSVSPRGLLGMIDSLRNVVSQLSWQPAGTEWVDYYESHSYTSESECHKKQVVAEYLERAKPATVWDLGANTGVYSLLAVQKGANTVAFDIDPACIEKMYLECRKNNRFGLLPLCENLVSPSPAIGWDHQERMSLAERGPVDLVMALALVHHLAISNNLPLGHIADYFHRLCRFLIVEFVPKDDPQVVRLLRSRDDIFVDYNQQSFEAALRKRFAILSSQQLSESGRVVYLCQSGSAQK